MGYCSGIQSSAKVFSEVTKIAFMRKIRAQKCIDLMVQIKTRLTCPSLIIHHCAENGADANLPSCASRAGGHSIQNPLGWQIDHPNITLPWRGTNYCTPAARASIFPCQLVHLVWCYGDNKMNHRFICSMWFWAWYECHGLHQWILIRRTTRIDPYLDLMR